MVMHCGIISLLIAFAGVLAALNDTRIEQLKGGENKEPPDQSSIFAQLYDRMRSVLQAGPSNLTLLL